MALETKKDLSFFFPNGILYLGMWISNSRYAFLEQLKQEFAEGLNSLWWTLV